MGKLGMIISMVSRIPFEKLFSRPRSNSQALERLETALRGSQSQKEVPSEEKPSSTISGTKRPQLPTTKETTETLKRRLAKELYRAELDLSQKLRIAGKPCDCLDAKHSLGLEAATEELISLDPGNPVYREILDWLEGNRSKVTVEAITTGKYDEEYPLMAGEFRGFRKRVLGSTELTAMTEPEPKISLEEAKSLAAEEAVREVERRWETPSGEITESIKSGLDTR